MKLEFFADVHENGTIKIIKRKEFDRLVGLNFAGKTILLEVSLKKRKRSNEANRYYWGAVIPIVQQGLKDCGILINKEQTHEMLVDRFLKEPLITDDGEQIGEITRSTSKLSVSEFMDYLAMIQEFAREKLCIEIPPPNEQIKAV